MDKKDFLIDITETISKSVIKNYQDTFDPTISYSDGTKAHVGWSARKNATVGICRRIPRVIYYNESKIRKLDYAELIDLASHECAHLIYDGHGEEFWNVYHTIIDECAETIKLNSIRDNKKEA
jgi:predicted metal-dependent hydrolase